MLMQPNVRCCPHVGAVGQVEVLETQIVADAGLKQHAQRDPGETALFCQLFHLWLPAPSARVLMCLEA